MIPKPHTWGHRAGMRKPCRICGAERPHGSPKNRHQVAVCEACYPKYLKENVQQHFISIYLPGKMKTHLERRAKQVGIPCGRYIRRVLAADLYGRATPGK